MTAPKLPIAGCPHLSLAAQNDGQLRQRHLATLRALGFSIEANRVVPPKDANSSGIISAITAALQEARSGFKN